MGFKSPFNTDVLPMLRFPWACLCSENDDVVFIESHPGWESRECAARLVGDVIGQTRQAIDRIIQQIDATGLTFHAVARTEVTLSSDVTDEQLPELFEMLHIFPGEVEVDYENPTFLFGRPQTSPEKLIMIEVMLVR